MTAAQQALRFDSGFIGHVVRVKDYALDCALTFPAVPSFCLADELAGVMREAMPGHDVKVIPFGLFSDERAKADLDAAKLRELLEAANSADHPGLELLRLIGTRNHNGAAQ